ncbi:FACT complex subunit SPT16 [Dermatophagoides pteronyssinus]|uniref:FACT complex subunit n=1 Tax=Dermatophagoides pteronyssinus TaxID=6956 RepID=A0ABQ8JVH5_DERPT|nr:FACT complex subunit SPT16 [Dermatophagoides pteronyssinus]
MSQSSISIDKDAFFRRIRLLYNAWKNGHDEELYTNLMKCDAIMVAIGLENEVLYCKSSAIQTWLFGYEMTDVIMVFCKRNLFILASKKKVDFLKTIESGKENESESLPSITLLVRDKTDKDSSNFDKLLSAIENSGTGKNLGAFIKDKFPGEFTVEWQKRLDGKKFNVIDISIPIAYLMAAKDDYEINLMTKSSMLTCELYTKYLKEELTRIIDEDRKVRHIKLTEGVEQASQNKKYIKNIDTTQVELCYPAIIQSGGQYNLKFSASSDKNILHFGTITCSLGLRYRQYCSNIVRTLLVNPTDEQKKHYEFLLTVQEAILERLRPGTILSDVYQMATDMVAKYDRKLVEKFTRNCGFIMGIEFRESSLQIAPKSSAIVKRGMTFNVSLGFANLENHEAQDEQNKIYALFIGDTVLKLKNIAIIIRDDDDEEEEEEEQDDKMDDVVKDALQSRGGRRTAVIDTKLRSEATDVEKRRQHQRELAVSLNEEARARLAQKSGHKGEERARKSTISYRSTQQMPQEREIQELKIYVDKRFETIILPIFGIPVPFHISTIKNISQSIEGDYTYLRINFFTPGTTITKQESSMFASNANQTFLKELTYRSTNLKEAGEISAPSSNLNTAFRLIKEVQKKFKTREAEEREMEGIVKQDQLILSNSKTNPRLKDLYIKPNIIAKRIHGTLEAHQNGFRFTSIRGDKIDIMYNNIKHAFFQPCDGEMLILLHFHLKNPIMFGKKKQTDVQFYTEVGEITTDLGKHQHMHDRDDLAAEQAEREMRQKLKSAFQLFCDKVEAMTKQEVDFDVPFRDLGFYGVPNRSNVLLQPTSGCLVNLTDWPPFVISLEDIELVHFERVQFHLKNFDMVFVFKDYFRKVATVNSIPMNMLDHVKEWLNSCDIRYTEGIQSLNWAKIMKTITDDPEDFFDNGGWSFLDANDSDEGEGDEELDEEDEVYDPSASEFDDNEESESEYSDESISEDDSSDERSLSSSEESGKDWSELEEEAAKADRNLGEFVDDYTAKKRKVMSKGSGGGGKSEKSSSNHHRPHHNNNNHHSNSLKRRSDIK